MQQSDLQYYSFFRSIPTSTYLNVTFCVAVRLRYFEMTLDNFQRYSGRVFLPNVSSCVFLNCLQQ